MNDKTPEAFNRMLDDLPVGQAPIEGLVTAGRAVRHRRQRTTLSGVVAATILVVGGVAFSSAALTSGDHEPPVAAPSGQPVDLPTSQWRPGQLGFEARISGTLGLDENDCVVLHHPSAGTRTYAYWPAGYTATIDADGVHLFDPDGTEVARQGDVVEMDGGYGPAPRNPQTCLPTGQGEVASIQSNVTVISSPRPDDLPDATPPANVPSSLSCPGDESVGTPGGYIARMPDGFDTREEAVAYWLAHSNAPDRRDWTNANFVISADGRMAWVLRGDGTAQARLHLLKHDGFTVHGYDACVR